MKLTKQDEILIRDLEEFANDSDVNESGIYTKILDLIRRLQYDCSSASKASNEWKEKYEAECKESTEQKAEIERLTEERDGYLDDRFAVCHALREMKKANGELQKQVDGLKDIIGKSNLRIECHAPAIKDCPIAKQEIKVIATEIFNWLKSKVIMTEIPHGSEPCEENVEAVMWWQIEEYFKKKHGVEEK